MAKSKKTDTDVLEPVSVKAVIVPDEVPEDEIEKVEKDIEVSVKKYNVTKAVLSMLKEKHKDLTINGQEDKEGYTAVHNARMEFVNTRVLITKVCKAGREISTLTNKKWIAKEKELIGEISPDEDRLEKMEKEFDAVKERIKFERLEMQRNRLRGRISELLKMGATNDGVVVYLDSVSFSMTDIREAEEEDWLTDILPEYKKVFYVKENVRLEAEAKKKKDDDEQQEKMNEFNRQRREFTEQQEKFEKEKKQAALDKRNVRMVQLRDLGMKPVFPTGDFVYNETDGVSVLNKDIDEDADHVWLKRIDDIRLIINQLITNAEQKRKEDEEKRQEDARVKAEKELLIKTRESELRAMGLSPMDHQWTFYKGVQISLMKMSDVPTPFVIAEANQGEWSALKIELDKYIVVEEELIAKELKEKILREENNRKEQERLKQLEQDEQASDKEKWDTFISALNAVKVPTMKRQPYKEFVENAAVFIKKINGLKK